ncbi:hypothetical protein [Novosphingobium sp. AP12]|uniref:hypothetical protein n=1 Tax=Novosphingobium sp. AP12 TaxID=1144305 RepID=UPI0012FC78CC|nr:hypothetical protein [Novosphingobium sp. AP12]
MAPDAPTPKDRPPEAPISNGQPGWRAALLATVPLMLLGSGFGALASDPETLSDAAVKQAKRPAWSARVAPRSCLVPRNSAFGASNFGIRIVPGSLGKKHCEDDVTFMRLKGADPLKEPLKVTITYRVQDRTGWFNAAVGARAHCGPDSRMESDSAFHVRCPWHRDTPGASEGIYYISLWVPADIVNARPGFTLRLRLEAETVGKASAGAVMIQSITMEGAT